jgi:hypothetical protein
MKQGVVKMRHISCRFSVFFVLGIHPAWSFVFACLVTTYDFDD